MADKQILVECEDCRLHVGPLTAVKEMLKRINQNRNVVQAEPIPNLAKRLHRTTKVQSIYSHVDHSYVSFTTKGTGGCEKPKDTI